MNPKRIIIVGTMAFVITVSGGIWADKTSASPLSKSGSFKTKDGGTPARHHTAGQDAFLRGLGASSDEDVFTALYNGKSLADIAAANHADIQSIIDLQVSELTRQLQERLARGSITPDQFEAQKAELPGLITGSAYGASKA
ncbi:SHOCT domain-containing protein [Paenibacillus humicola]|uniref:SHOCT domain-containing protein n=1 Tax=Paenibacillus humicola TaxID=3110540 RepID=UPI00237B9BCB|nr:SHOCT domain-containing protein [Paenibacillus humicola]